MVLYLWTTQPQTTSHWNSLKSSLQYIFKNYESLFLLILRVEMLLLGSCCNGSFILITCMTSSQCIVRLSPLKTFLLKTFLCQHFYTRLIAWFSNGYKDHTRWYSNLFCAWSSVKKSCTYNQWREDWEILNASSILWSLMEGQAQYSKSSTNSGIPDIFMTYDDNPRF